MEEGESKTLGKPSWQTRHQDRGEGNKLHRLEANLIAEKQIRHTPAGGAYTRQLRLILNGLTQAKLVHSLRQD